MDAFNVVCGVGLAIFLGLMGSLVYDAGQSSVAKNCKNYGAFIEGRIKYECKPLETIVE